MYNEGIARFATESIDVLYLDYEKATDGNIDNRFSHLTNYAINKQHENFNIEEEGSAINHKRLITSVFKN